MLKTRTWIILILAAALVSAVLAFLFLKGSGRGKVVEILQDGEVVRRIDLSQVTETYSFVLENGSGGSNRITVEPGRICVSEANCPDGICMHQGWLSDQPMPIVCLPNKLVIRSGSRSEVDASVG